MYEYKIYNATGPSHEIEAQLNEFAKDRWRVIAVIPADGYSKIVLERTKRGERPV